MTASQLKDIGLTEDDVERHVPATPSSDKKEPPKNLIRHVNDSLSTSETLSALHERQGTAIAFSETDREGLAIGAKLDESGGVNMSFTGSSPQNEADTIHACEVLMQALNLKGETWGTVRRDQEPADCTLVDASASGRTLDVQVVRAIVTPQLWRELNRDGSAQASLLPDGAANELRAAIKLKVGRIPESIRQRLVLALDATRLPGLAFDNIVQEFKRSSAAWVASHRFAAVWLVGPAPLLVWRLDC
jgi:hypothetical protein